jgi:hypothetical protein
MKASIEIAGEILDLQILTEGFIDSRGPKYEEVLTYYRKSLTDMGNQKFSEDIRSQMSFVGKDANDAGK